ncbi:hypothetical protein [Streptomyces sp. NPDC047981]|uniref:hypothetical protein n=1 Tax=Streptomyces sp. NPDC047981 TaxID=3154610 RepID=UPI00341762A4
MPNTTAQTVETTPAPASHQGSHHWVMTLQMPGFGSVSAHGTWTPPAGCTRSDAFLAIKDDMVRRNPQMERANVLFFSFEPNTL